MRRPRLKAPSSHPFAIYHCISRIVNRDFVLQPKERNQFLRYMREYEIFCGVKVRAYCILSNHFHIQVEVPARPQTLPEPEVLLQRLEVLTSTGRSVEGVRQQIQAFRERGDTEGERTFWERFCAPMWDVSHFMKLVKQRFSQWYNKIHKRKGTLWEERFRSVLVEPGGRAEQVMSAYIDLNPVRATLVKDPKDYRWCGYGEALAMGGRACEWVMRLMGEKDPKKALQQYRMMMFALGEEGREGSDEHGRPLRRGITREQLQQVLDQGGKLSRGEMLRLRVGYLTEGAVFGSLEFVEQMTAHLCKGRRARRAEGLGAELYFLGRGRQPKG